jgi:hypothetical protein
MKYQLFMTTLHDI